MSSADTQSFSVLLGDAFSQLTKLFQNEIDLARTELSEKLQNARVAVTLMVAAISLLIPAIVIVLFAVASLLIDAGFSASFSYFCVGAVVALMGAAVLVTGLRRLSESGVMPTKAFEQFRRDRVAVKELAR